MVVEVVDMEVYICLCCAYPVIFRGRPPQVYHMGTGWYCWRKVKGEDDRSDEPLPIAKFSFTTPKPRRQQLLKRAKKLWQEYKDRDDSAPIIRFVEANLNAGRSDVVYDLLVYLAAQEDKRRDKLVRGIVSSAAWQRFAQALKGGVKWESGRI